LGIFVICSIALHATPLGTLLCLILGGCITTLIFLFIHPIPIGIPPEYDVDEDEDQRTLSK